jgi:phosphoenolpyruvate carboxylase
LVIKNSFGEAKASPYIHHIIIKVMSNMSYCRFENTYHDLQDCYENINRKASNERDERYRLRLKELVKEMSKIVDDEDFEDED